mmetsp:Transcript_33651/g.84370  ORF Transcript_33651/g.84370 Transcript_33651/m.84370 type:complete len:709 (+) Transcript_33651:273-2399(+)
MGGTERCADTFFIVNLINNIKGFSSYGVLLFIFLAHCRSLGITWKETLCPAHKAHVRHWTLGASSGIFRETVYTVMQAQNLNTIVTVVVLLVCRIPMAAATMNDMGLRSYKGKLQWEAGISDICGPGFSLCRGAWFTIGTVTWTNAWMMVTLTSMIVSTPSRLWSPVSRQAIASTRHTRLWRTLWIPVIGLPVGIWFLVALWLTLMVVTEGRVASLRAPTIIMSWSLNVALMVVLVFIMFWMNGVMPCKEWAEAAKAQAAKDASQSDRLFAATAGAQNNAAGENAGLLGHHPAAGARGWRQWASWHGLVFKLRQMRVEPGVRYMRQTLLLLDIFLWATNVTFWLTSIPAMLAVWGCRVGLLAALLLGSGEQPADFSPLQRNGVGFGLVVGAKELADALERAVDGRRLPARLPLYKASALRMKETLAVSYRWQEEQVELAEGAWVNMTSWQMRTLAETIRSSTALYVWLDHLSVPQQTHPELMNTLLSRMMAVYTAAGVTLSLRSCEREGSRYHQRGWTAQEYCTAPRMIVITQEDPADAEASLSAYFHAEEGTLQSVRRWWQTQARRCRPFWLYGGVAHISDAQLRATMRKYEKLESQVHTEDPADVLRALYPLMFHVPVENQDELVELIKQVNERQGRVEPKLQFLEMGTCDGRSLWKSSVRETHVQSIIGPTVQGTNDEVTEEEDWRRGISARELPHVPSPRATLE